jgi:hypothetical protein
LTIARAPIERAKSTTSVEKGSEQRRVLAHRAVDDRDDDLVVQVGRAADHVEVAVGDRVIAARAHGDGVVWSGHW